MLIPSSLGLVLTTMPPERVKRSVRLWAVSGAAAGAIGPVVGGVLTSLSWRWIFMINLPIGIAAIAVTWKMIPHVRHDFSTKMPDPIGSVMAILRGAPPSAPASPQPEPMSTVVEQSERNAMVILNLTRFPIGTYLCAGWRI